MDTDDLAFCRDYFAMEKRDRRLPKSNDRYLLVKPLPPHHSLPKSEAAEIGDPEIDFAWKEYLKTRESLGIKKPVTLMDIATIAVKYLKKENRLTKLDESEEINACTVKIKVDFDGNTEDWLLLFKNETHNHPTEIEPFGGAATCIGGAIRDPLSGRAYVYAAMRVSGTADPLAPVSETHSR